MTTGRRIEANHANARMSTGPRTKEGKARASRNALRHGLNVSVLASSAFSGQVEDLARKIVGQYSSAVALEYARRVAEAQVDIDRIRKLQLELLLDDQHDPDRVPGALVENPAQSLFNVGGGAEALAADPPRKVRLLGSLERYERRALSRRKSAIREFDAVCTELREQQTDPETPATESAR